MFFKRPNKNTSSHAAPPIELSKLETAKSSVRERRAQRLTADDLRAVVDARSLGFNTTADLAPAALPIGQTRAVRALEFGASMRAPDFHIFVLGRPGLGRRMTVRAVLSSLARELPAPPDWVYVFNFANPDQPKALRLARGQARELKSAMQEAMRELRVTLPAAYDNEEYRVRRTAIDEQYHSEQSDVIQALHQRAAAQNIAIVRTPLGFGMAPMHAGKVVKPEVFNQLPEAMRREVEVRIETLQKELEACLAEAPAANRLREQHIAELDQDFARTAVEAALEGVSLKFADNAGVAAFLAAVEEDLIKSAGAHREILRAGGDAAQAYLRRYSVTIVADGANSEGAPIVEEANPLLVNLMGHIGGVVTQGALLPDFTLIRPGALHRANGGYLILDAAKVTSRSDSWSWLKRTLLTGKIAIEGEAGAGTDLGRMLMPEAIPCAVKVILIGDREVYEKLAEEDPEFSRLFKVPVEFDEAMERSGNGDADFAGLVASLVATHKLKPIDADGVARLMEEALRLAESRNKLSLDIGRISDIVLEADHWASEARREVITRDDVARAVHECARRAALPRDRFQDSIMRGVILIDTDGEKVGQVNAMSLCESGRFVYGRPSRITARVRLGQGRITDIERETTLGGAHHSKGVMILWGYLAGRFAQDIPLALAASLVFEQSYTAIEGDSAASAELYAILSALADVPIRQGIAVTGSINQLGEVQAVGGINEKIEGFFDLCNARGLTGNQGVLIPRANVPNLMLREDIVRAAKSEKFSVYSFSTIDEGAEILTGLPAGERGADGTFPTQSLNGRVQTRLKAFADRAQHFNCAAEKTVRGL